MNVMEIDGPHKFQRVQLDDIVKDYMKGMGTEELLKKYVDIHVPEIKNRVVLYIKEIKNVDDQMFKRYRVTGKFRLKEDKFCRKAVNRFTNLNIEQTGSVINALIKNGWTPIWHVRKTREKNESLDQNSSAEVETVISQ